MRLCLLALVAVGLNGPKDAHAAKGEGYFGLRPARSAPATRVEVQQDESAFTLENGEPIAGFRLGDAPEGPLKNQAERMVRLIRDEFHRDASRVPIHILNASQMDRLTRQLGGHTGFRWEIYGMHYRGHIFIRPGLTILSDEVLLHELIHEMSARFAAESRGFSHLVEGLAQHYTSKILASELDKKATKRIYVRYREFAEVLESIVGGDRLRALFFAEKGDPLQELKMRVDQVRGNLLPAAAALEKDRFNDALRLLSAK